MGTFGFNGTGRFNLGVIERRSGVAILKYEGIKGTPFTNKCYSSTSLVVAELQNYLQQLMWIEAQYRRTKANSKVAELYQKEVKPLRDLLSQLTQEVDRYGLPFNTPVCLYESSVIQAHESTHALLNQLMPQSDAYGTPLSTPYYLMRQDAIRAAADYFFRDLGPASTKYYRTLMPLIARTQSEELLSGMAGFVSDVARTKRSKQPSHKSVLIPAINSYLTQGRPPARPALEKIVYDAAEEWYKKYGSNISKAIVAFGTHLKRELERRGVIPARTAA